MKPGRSGERCRCCHADLACAVAPGSKWRDVLCEACIYLVGGDRYAHASLDAEEADRYFKALSDLLGGVPSYRWRDTFVRGLGSDDETSLLLAMFARRIPWSVWYRKRHEGWLATLTATGVLSEGTSRRQLGIHTNADDGHACWSLGELHLDNWMHGNQIPHTREPRYPDSNYRADFAVGNVMVEYLGLAGRPEYEEITDQKRQLARKHGLKLVCVYPEDLEEWDRKAAGVARKLGHPDAVAWKRPRTTDDVIGVFTKYAIDPTDWPHPRPAARTTGTETWERDPYRVGTARLRAGDLWTRRIRDSYGRELKHTPGINPRAWERLIRLQRRKPDEFDDLEIAAANGLIDATEAGRRPDYAALWPLLDAAQSAAVLDDLSGFSGAWLLGKALHSAYDNGDAEVALAIVAELEPNDGRLNAFQRMVRDSLPRHGFAADPVAAGLAAQVTNRVEARGPLILDTSKWRAAVRNLVRERGNRRAR